MYLRIKSYGAPVYKYVLSVSTYIYYNGIDNNCPEINI